jgi:hypothetical protein
MSSANRDSLTTSFPICIPFIYSSCFTTVARNSKTVLNRSGVNMHPCFIPEFRGNGFSFSPLSMMLALKCWGTFLLFLVSSELLSSNGVESYQSLFLLLLKWSDDFVFACINFLYYIYRFTYVEPPLHPWDEADLVMVYDLSEMLLDSVCHYFIEDLCISVH